MPQTSAGARSASADRAAVARLEQRWVADLASANRRDLASTLADDYPDIDWRGDTRG